MTHCVQAFLVIRYRNQTGLNQVEFIQGHNRQPFGPPRTGNSSQIIEFLAWTGNKTRKSLKYKLLSLSFHILIHLCLLFFSIGFLCLNMTAIDGNKA